LDGVLLKPRYDAGPFLTIDGPDDDQRETVVRQRARLAGALAGLDADGWAAPSRCEGWSAQDVVAHLITTNTFWVASIGAGIAGMPTRFLATFDPHASPPQMVDAMRAMSPAETLDRFVETNEALFGLVATLDANAWRALAEAPPGHVPVRLVAHHALWDAWVHERDILLPLGRAVAEEPDEIEACLRYAAALGPVLGLGDGRTGAIAIEATRPDVSCVVSVGDTVTVRRGPAPPGAARLAGRAVDLVEMLSIRAPFTAMPEDQRWLFGGLAGVFDTAVTFA
jgi:uncharacterized protein (TIGR03083 family)